MLICPACPATLAYRDEDNTLICSHCGRTIVDIDDRAQIMRAKTLLDIEKTYRPRAPYTYRDRTRSKK